jgi:hypothetical protein
MRDEGGKIANSSFILPPSSFPRRVRRCITPSTPFVRFRSKYYPIDYLKDYSLESNEKKIGI